MLAVPVLLTSMLALSVLLMVWGSGPQELRLLNPHGASTGKTAILSVSSFLEETANKLSSIIFVVDVVIKSVSY